MTDMGDRRVLTTGNFKEMPKIVCLCGSSRFHLAFVQANYEETMKGNIVLSIGFADYSSHGQTIGCTPEQKIAVDELHLRKIDLADEVYVLNVDGYIGDSTFKEIKYAQALKMPIRYLEPISSRVGTAVLDFDSEIEYIKKMDKNG